MNPTGHSEVKIVFDSHGGRARGAPARRRPLWVLAMLNVCVVGGLFYAGWWPVNNWMEDVLFWHAPIMKAKDASRLFGAMFGPLPPEPVKNVPSSTPKAAPLSGGMPPAKPKATPPPKSAPPSKPEARPPSGAERPANVTGAEASDMADDTSRRAGAGADAATSAAAEPWSSRWFVTASHADSLRQRLIRKSVRREVMVTTIYGWQTLVALSMCALMLAAGACAGCGLSRGARRWSMLLAGLAFVSLAGVVWAVWDEYHGGFPVDAGRLAIGWLVLAFGILGVSMGRGVVTLNRVAAGLLILSALGTALGLEIGARCDALEPFQATATFIAGLLVLHSAYAWLLLIVTLIMRRRARPVQAEAPSA